MLDLNELKKQKSALEADIAVITSKLEEASKKEAEIIEKLKGFGYSEEWLADKDNIENEIVKMEAKLNNIKDEILKLKEEL